MHVQQWIPWMPSPAPKILLTMSATNLVPNSRTFLSSSWIGSSIAISSGGMIVLEKAVLRLKLANVWMGMMPGTIGIVIPAART